MKNKNNKKIIKEFFENVLVYFHATSVFLFITIILLFLLYGWINNYNALNVSISCLLIYIFTGLFISSWVLVKNVVNEK